MTPESPAPAGAPTFDAIFKVMGAVSVGNVDARVIIPAPPDLNDIPTRFGIALNVLLRDLSERTAAHHAQLATIRKQQEAILSLSTPMLVVAERVLLMPLIGVLNAERADHLIEGALEAIHTTGARVVLIDLTGLLTVDEFAAKGLIKLVQAASLLGATSLLCGIGARVAMEIKAVGADVTQLRMVSSLRAGLVEAQHCLATAPNRNGATHSS
ncbi:hypothetical protein LBMAG42_42570 [Deltaproteobacteria bacterium]|nr:hypothetical protein LBMAG42_42570 [Deltaproteobacteria bacterium]